MINKLPLVRLYGIKQGIQLPSFRLVLYVDGMILPWILKPHSVASQNV